MQLLGGKKCISVCLTTKSVQIWHRIDLGIFARLLAKTRQVAGSALKKERDVHDILFSGVDEGADDEAAEGGVGGGVRIGIAVGFLAVVCVFLFPLGTEFGGIHDDRGLFDRLCERRNSLLARGRKRTFIRMFDYISMRATVAGTHDNLIGGTEFARHGVEGMRESCSCHS